MNRQVFDELMRRGLGDLRPQKVATVLDEMVAQLGDVEPEVLARHDVHPSATALRDLLGERLDGVVRLSPYDTRRQDARRLGHTLGWVVALLRQKVTLGGEVDLERLVAYEDELAVRGLGG